MNLARRPFLSVAASTAALPPLISPAAALAQGTIAPTSARQNALKDQLIGTWMLESIYDEDERSMDVDPFPDDPQGVVMFDANGRFSFQIVGKAVTYESNDRWRGTALENAIAVQALLIYFGTYSVDAAARELTLDVSRCSFPNWNGTRRKASVAVKDDQLDLTSVLDPSLTGSFYSHSVWKRVR